MNDSFFLLIAAALITSLLCIFITWMLLNNRHRNLLQAERDNHHNATAALQTELAERTQQYRFTAEQHSATEAALADSRREQHAQQAQVQELQSQIAADREHITHLQSRDQERRQLLADYEQLQRTLADTQLRSERLHTQIDQERQSHQDKITLLTEARQSLSDQFQNLANTILEEKTKKFTEHNAQSLNQLLTPLNDRMGQFSQLIQNTYEKEAKERLTLENELKRLQSLNTQLHTDAKALTEALIGTRNKSQGNWGEMILEKILENSGLSKGREYLVQAAGIQTTEDGSTRRLQPDVLINLPDRKQIIIDAKMSLTAYVRYTQADSVEAADRELAAHLTSVRQHIKTLSAKQYSDIEGLITLDFVFMFIPIEPAYLLALQQDNQLFQECFDKRIMLVGPSTLLATLRTVANLWRNEQQNQNALKIAEEGGKLYDKFVGFITTFQNVGKNLEQAQSQYNAAFKQLSEGSGNLVNRADKLRLLGVKASKQLERNLVEQAQQTASPPLQAPDSNP